MTDRTDTTDTTAKPPSGRGTHPRAEEGPGLRSSPDAAPPLPPELVAELEHASLPFSATDILNVMRQQAGRRGWDDIVPGLTASEVGKTITALGLPRRHVNHARAYTVTLAHLAHLIDAYCLNLPPLLTQYHHFSAAALQAHLNPEPNP